MKKSLTKEETPPAVCKGCLQKIPSGEVGKHGPFCSERCKLQDLSKWFGENYRIASSPAQQTTDQTEE